MAENTKKLLIIEDDAHVSKIYDVMFSKEGFKTIFAASGEEGVIKTIEEKPNLIILDLMLLAKDGFAFLEEIKKSPELAQIPVIVISNLGQDSDKDRAMALGAKEYLVKVDNSMQQVIEMVKSYLN